LKGKDYGDSGKNRTRGLKPLLTSMRDPLRKSPLLNTSGTISKIRKPNNVTE